MHLGYIRDSTSHSVLNSLKIYDPQDTSRDPTRAVVWRAGEQDHAAMVEYEGLLSLHTVAGSSDARAGAMKFNGILEWLQLLTVSNPSPKQQKQEPVKMPEPEAEPRIVPSPVEEAPDALPAEGVSDELPIRLESAAAAPEPEAEFAEEAGQTPQETEMRHVEL